MIIKGKNQETSSINRKRRIGTDILFGAFLIVAISGFIIVYMKINPTNSVWMLNLWCRAFIHRISALISLIFTIPHVYKHRKWYKKLYPLRRKSKITVTHSISFFITLVITIALAVKREYAPLEIIHSVVGCIAVVFISIHALKRYYIIK